MTRNLPDIAADLEKLAPGKTTGENALRNLATLLKRRDCSDLAGVDLVKTYDPAVMLPDDTPGRRHWAGGLELLRDILIFVPIIYTWFKISDALVAYNTYKGDAPFMLAWQQGFGNGTEPLSTSASVVATVVLIVIGLTWVAHIVRGRSDRRVQDRQQTLAVLLGEAGFALTRSLTVGAAVGVSRADLTAIASQIAASSEALEKAFAKSSTEIITAVNTNPGSKLHEMFQNWTAAANELTKLGGRLSGTQETIDQLKGVQAALAGMAEQIGAETKKLLAALEAERSLSKHESHAHHELAVQVGESTKLLGQSLAGLNERAEQFNEMVLRMEFVVNRIESTNGYR